MFRRSAFRKDFTKLFIYEISVVLAFCKWRDNVYPRSIGPNAAQRNLGNFFWIPLRSIRARIGHVHSAIDWNRRRPIVKGGSPPKKRHMRSLPPFALHLKYAPKSGSPTRKRSCGMTCLLPSEGKLAETTFPRYMLMVGPSDASAVNPGMFISHLLIACCCNGV